MKNKTSNTKRLLIPLISILISLVLISTVTALPVTESIPLNESKKKLETTINKITNLPLYKQLKPLIESKIDKTVQSELRLSIEKNLFGGSLPTDYPFYPLLVDFILFLAEIIMLLLGHGITGSLVAATVALIITTVWCLFSSIGYGLGDALFATGEIINEFLISIAGEDWIYYFGLIGTVIVLVAMIPIAIILFIILIPIAYINNFFLDFENITKYVTEGWPTS